MKTKPEEGREGFTGELHGESVLWEANYSTGKVDMTPEEVLDTVKLIIEHEKAEAVREFAEKVKDIIAEDDDDTKSVIKLINFFSEYERGKNEN